jgi:hypothetical protein
MRVEAGEGAMTISPGLCATCSHAVVVRSDRGSTFVRCTHPQLPKYPRLPVLECVGWSPAPLSLAPIQNME